MRIEVEEKYGAVVDDFVSQSKVASDVDAAATCEVAMESVVVFMVA